MTKQTETPEGKKAHLAWTKATAESLPLLVQSASIAGISTRAIAGINDRASRDLQDVLTQMVDALYTNEHGIRTGMDQSAVLQSRNTLYYDLIKETREAGHAAYEAHKKEGCLRKDSSYKEKSKNTYGKDARANISNKRKAIRNIFWAMTDPDLAAEVRAIMKPDANQKRSSWTKVVAVARKKMDRELLASNKHVNVARPLNNYGDIWFLRDELANYNTEEVDGSTVATVRWGTGDNAYDIEFVGQMKIKDVVAELERDIADLGRRKSKMESDLEALRETSVPEEHILPSATNDS